jgi:hypothetical protein
MSIFFGAGGIRCTSANKSLTSRPCETGFHFLQKTQVSVRAADLVRADLIKDTFRNRLAIFKMSDIEATRTLPSLFRFAYDLIPCRQEHISLVSASFLAFAGVASLAPQRRLNRPSRQLKPTVNDDDLTEYLANASQPPIFFAN